MPEGWFLIFEDRCLTRFWLQEQFFKVIVLKNFAIFTWKKLRLSLLLIKSQAWSPATFLKRNSNTGVFLPISRNFKNIFFYRTPLVDTSRKCASVYIPKYLRYKSSVQNSTFPLIAHYGFRCPSTSLHVYWVGIINYWRIGTFSRKYFMSCNL